MSLLKQYTDLTNTRAAKAILSLQHQPMWPELPETAIPQAFPLSTLPPIGRDMAESLAEAMQVHPDMAACFLLGAVSTCVVGRGKVQVRPDYSEPLQLYIAVIANPSERKSPTLSRIFHPLYEYEAHRAEELSDEIRDAQTKIAIKKKQLDNVQKKGHEADALAIAREIEELGTIVPYELMIAEGTPEAIVERMSANNGRIAVVSAEGALLDILSGMYAESGVNLDAVLQGYSGEPVNSARVGRKANKIRCANLSITLAVQPVTIEDMLSNELLLRRGIVSRFLFSYPPTSLGARDSVNAKPVPESVSSRYTRLLESILNQSETKLLLSPEALSVFNLWDQEVEGRLAPDKDLDRLPSGWGGKVLGNTARIAGLLCLLEGDGIVVQDYTMQSAITIMQYFIEQIRSLSGFNSYLSMDASEVLNHILRKQQDEFAPYLLRQSLRSRRKFVKAEAVDAALGELQMKGYIKPKPETDYQGIGRPPQPMYLVHPSLLRKENVEVLNL